MKKFFLFIFLYSIISTCIAQELRLYGGEKGHHVFLGCLTCDKHSSSSVCNKYGEYGSKYGGTSIWNKYGAYGSKYSATSPWNKYASDPPVIVDPEGNFYGYFTANSYHDKRTKIDTFSYMANNADVIANNLDNARDWYCNE